MNLCIINAGAQTPNGTDLTMSVATLLANIARIYTFRPIEDSDFNPVSLGLARYLPDDLHLSERFTELFIPALQETVGVVDETECDSASIPVLVGLPKQRPGLDDDMESILASALNGSDIALKKRCLLEFIREDHDSGLIGMSEAERRLSSGEAEVVVVGGVESYIDPRTIEWLEEKRLLKCTSNRFGFIPGEAAVFCLLTTDAFAAKKEWPIKARIRAISSAHETALPGSNIQATGKALTQVLRDVLTALPEEESIAEIFCTLKGLRQEAEEHAYSLPRIGRYLDKPGEFLSVAGYWGDVGTASAPALIAYAMEKAALRNEKGSYNLIFTQSPGGSRSAALLEIP